MLRKIVILAGVLIAVGIFTEPAFAGRLLESQGDYMADTATAWEVALKGFLFLMGLAAIGFSGWHMLMDYVFAKADHEKKFSVGKLLVGAIIGSLLCVPYGAILIGSDLVGTTETTLTEGDFQRDSDE